MDLVRIYSRFVCFCAVLLLLPGIAAAAGTAKQAGIEAIKTAEQAHDWALAKQLGAQLLSTTQGAEQNRLKAHLAKLDKASAAWSLAEEYHRLGQTQEAAKLLESAKTLVNAEIHDLDSALSIAIVTQLQAYENELLAAKKAEFDAELNRVTSLEDDGRWEVAEQRMTALIKAAKDSLDGHTLSDYKDKLIEIQKKKYHEANPDFVTGILNSTVEQFEAVAQPLFIFAIVVLVYLLWRFLFRPWRGHFMEIILDDQSDAADADKKAEANKVLSQEFDQSLKRIVSEINEGGELDGLIDLQGAELSSTSARQVDGARVTEFLQSDPIQIGVIKFTPKSLFEMLAHMTRTRGDSVISGALFKDTSVGDDGKAKQEYVLHIEKRGPNGEPKSTKLFFEGRGDTREAAITQAAMQLVVNESRSTVTRDWRSLEAMVRAKELLEDQIEYSLSTRRAEGDARADQATDTESTSILDKLNAARSLLQKSLAIDPSNWVARYRLANVMRKIGDDRTAYWQYAYVLDMLCSEQQNEHNNLLGYVKSRPSFPFKVLFKKNVSRARQGAIYLKSNSRETRQSGFKLVTTALAEMKLLASNIQDLCVQKDIRLELGMVIKEIDDISRLYAIERVTKPVDDTDSNGEAGDVKPLFSPDNYTEKQVQKLRQVYKRILKDNKRWYSINVFGSGSQEGQEFSLETEKIIVFDLIYQINSGITDILAELYEYHSDFKEDTYRGNEDDILDCLNKLEARLFKMRTQLDDQNRNAYAVSHAVAHNAVGRASYVKLRNLLGARPAEDSDEKVREYFNRSEKYLRWAIGYHVPASFAGPYMNLASLYIKVLEHPRLKNYMPTDWKTRTEEYLVQAIRLSPNCKKARYLLGRLYQSRISEDIFLPEARRDSDAAYFHKALRQFEEADEDSFSYFRAGEILAERKEYQQAITKLQLCMSVYHRYDEPHQLYLAVICKHLDNKLDALTRKYSESEEKRIKRMLDEALRMGDRVLSLCFDGDQVTAGVNCSAKLDFSKITASVKQLNEQASRLKNAKKNAALYRSQE